MGNTLRDNNQQRMAALKIEIVALFANVANDLRYILDMDITQDNIRQEPKVERYGDFQIEYFEFEYNPQKMLIERARNLRDNLRLAYSVCSTPETLTRTGPKLADAFIASCTGAQMFKFMPEIIMEDDEEVQKDIAGYITRTEQIVSTFQVSRTEDGQRSAQSFLKAVGADDNSDVILKLDAARDVLGAVQKIYKDPSFICDI